MGAADGNVFSAYPHLTFNRLSMINTGAVYFSHFDISVVDALRKYDVRGSRYVNYAALGVCSTQWHTLTVNRCFWLNPLHRQICH